jgi:hypothetical protein
MGAASRIQAASRGYGYSLESMVKLDKHLKSLGNQGFRHSIGRHSIGLRVLTQMRGYPIWLDPRPGRYQAAGLQYFLCLGLPTPFKEWLERSTSSGTNKSGTVLADPVLPGLQ